MTRHTKLVRQTLRGALAAPLLAIMPVWAPTTGVGSATAPTAPAVTFMDHFAVTPCPPAAPAKALCATGHGDGAVPGPGATTEVVRATAVLAHPDPVTGCAPEVATVRLMPRGGAVMLHLTGQFCQTSPHTSIEVGYYLVTGGSGRFRGAGGHGVYEFSGAFVSTVSGTATHTYRGTLRL